MRTTRIVFKYLLVAFFVLGGINHFLDTDFYLNIMPEFLPFHQELVLMSGATEIIAGVMLATPRVSRLGAWFIIAHLVVFFTVHIDMAVHSERFPDLPPAGLYLRIAMQFVFIAWAFWFTRGGAPLPIPELEEAG